MTFLVKLENIRAIRRQLGQHGINLGLINEGAQVETDSIEPASLEEKNYLNALLDLDFSVFSQVEDHLKALGKQLVENITALKALTQKDQIAHRYSTIVILLTQAEFAARDRLQALQQASNQVDAVEQDDLFNQLKMRIQRLYEQELAELLQGSTHAFVNTKIAAEQKKSGLFFQNALNHYCAAVHQRTATLFMLANVVQCFYLEKNRESASALLGQYVKLAHGQADLTKEQNCARGMIRNGEIRHCRHAYDRTRPVVPRPTGYWARFKTEFKNNPTMRFWIYTALICAGAFATVMSAGAATVGVGAAFYGIAAWVGYQAPCVGLGVFSTGMFSLLAALLRHCVVSVYDSSRTQSMRADNGRNSFSASGNDFEPRRSTSSVLVLDDAPAVTFTRIPLPSVDAVETKQSNTGSLSLSRRR